MMDSFARRFGCTEGQLYTITTAALVTTLLAWSSNSRLPVAQSAAPSATPPVAVPAPLAPAIEVASPAPGAPSLLPLPLPLPAPTSGSVAAPLPPPFVDTTTTPTISGPMVFARIGRPGAPSGIAVTSDGGVFVATDNGTANGVPGPSQVLGFAADGTPTTNLAVTGQPDGHARGLTGLVVDRDGSLIALDAATSRVLRLNPAKQRQSVVATIPDLTPCVIALPLAPCEPGISDHLPALTAVAVDPRTGDVLVSDAGQGTIWRVSRGGLQPWYQSQDFAGGDGPAGIALDTAGSVLVTVGTTTDVHNFQNGGLYRIARNADGSAGPRTLMTSFASGGRPGPIAVGPKDTIFVIVRKTGSIVSVAGGSATPVSTAGAPLPLDQPGGLVVVGNRLLVTNESTANRPAHWAVLSFPI